MIKHTLKNTPHPSPPPFPPIHNLKYTTKIYRAMFTRNTRHFSRTHPLRSTCVTISVPFFILTFNPASDELDSFISIWHKFPYFGTPIPNSLGHLCLIVPQLKQFLRYIIPKIS